ncbi:exosortase A [Thalassotalea marina]|uniref:Methanolan biosynthesis EpsI domain-containing protein n=1 Tax=Thalassotalea marina TaxID=1673741 RepID=A0A919BN02_9GAMM|nr:exosortase A [Thalassotalea marina]GHF99369.1 hypothetical protein GCM10017161_29740 [Thalassotalea marina]
MRVTNGKFLLYFGVLIVAWLSLYWPAIIGMESIWRRSDTFAHGYFILPLSCWLIWRDRQVLLNSDISTSWLAAIVLLGSVLLGVVASIADVAVISQLSAVISLIAVVWLCIGDKLAWHYKFPLAYLLFLVPMGENLIPWLQDVTAWFTVFFLQLTGIPVFRDGLYIQTPTGLFEVAVACSGIRYLIASAAVGSLFAYLSYTKFKKQVIFTLFAVVLPIIANGIRAYLIVIIAHYSDMKYATGADHLVYGWLFFGLVIMLMFWLGGKFADPEPEKSSQGITSSSPFNAVLPMIAVLICLLSFGFLKQQHVSTVPNTPQALLEGETIDNSNWGIKFNASLAQSHIYFGQIELFAAKYANKQNQGELISFDNKLHDHESWTVITKEVFESNDKQVTYLLLRNTRGQERAYMYLYQLGNFSTGSNLKAKVFQVINTLSGQANNSYIFAVSELLQTNKSVDKKVMLETLENMIEQLDVNRD